MARGRAPRPARGPRGMPVGTSARQSGQRQSELRALPVPPRARGAREKNQIGISLYVYIRLRARDLWILTMDLTSNDTRRLAVGVPLPGV